MLWCGVWLEPEPLLQSDLLAPLTLTGVGPLFSQVLQRCKVSLYVLGPDPIIVKLESDSHRNRVRVLVLLKVLFFLTCFPIN